MCFRATLKVRLGSCLSSALEMENLDCTKKSMHISKKSQLVNGKGSFMSAKLLEIVFKTHQIWCASTVPPSTVSTPNLVCFYSTSQHTQGLVHFYYVHDVSVYLGRQRGGGVSDWRNKLEAFSCGFCPKRWSFERLLNEKCTAPGSKGRMHARNAFFWLGTSRPSVYLTDR